MQLKIMQWNVWYKEDVENVAKFIKSHDPDIVCLQELTIGYRDQSHSDTPKHIASYLDFEHAVKTFPTNPDGDDLLANGIFSRYPISTSRSVLINEPVGTGGYEDEYRAYVEAQISIDNVMLTIGTTHMSYTDRFKATKRKQTEVEKLRNEIEKNKSRFILTGDFNLTPQSTELRNLTRNLNNLSVPDNEKTWTTKPFSYGGFEETELDWRLDYIFGTKDWSLVSSEVLKTKYSDHLPLFSIIKLD